MKNKINQEATQWQKWHPKRGEVYLMDLGTNLGSEQNGIRPVIVVSNNIGNKYSNVVQIVPLTSSKKTQIPTHVTLTEKDGLKKESVACVEQVRCVSKQRGFINDYPIKICQLSPFKMAEIDEALKINFGLKEAGLA